MSTTSRWSALSTTAFLVTVLAASPAAPQEPIAPHLTTVSPGEGVAVRSASLSPDGRWLAFSRLESERHASLWLMPAGGGEASRLTDEGHWDDLPAWSGNDRIFFRSDRPARGGDGTFGMVLRLDPATGRPAGPPRQVTAEPMAPPSVEPSPDGRHVAYTTQAGGARLIRVIPASGGNARTIAELSDPPWNLAWASDRELVYTQRPGQGDTRVAFLVPIDGGDPVEIFRTDKNIRAVAPRGQAFATVTAGAGPRQWTVEVIRRDGRVVARHTGEDNLRPTHFTADGRRLVGASTEVTAPMRVVPVAGGRPVDVTAGDHYDWHAAWTPDADELLVYGTHGEGNAIIAVPRAGGAPTTPPLTLPADRADSQWGTVDADHALLLTRLDGTDRVRIEAVSRRDGSRRVLSESARRLPGIVGAGGTYDYQAGELLFFETRGERLELMGARADGQSRLIRSFPADLAGRTNFAVHGSRVAWMERDGNQVHIYSSPGADATPERLTSMAVGDRCCRLNLVFSHDGRRLLTEDPSAPDRSGDLVVFDLSADGRTVTDRRTVSSGAVYWYEAQWLPDNDAVTVLAGYEGLRTHVLLIPLREGEEPVNLTAADPAPKWGQLLSPDGRYVAYPAEMYHGGYAWIMDLGAAAGVAGSSR